MKKALTGLLRQIKTDKSSDKVEAAKDKCQKYQTVIWRRKQEYYKSQWEELRMSCYCLQNNGIKF